MFARSRRSLQARIIALTYCRISAYVIQIWTAFLKTFQKTDTTIVHLAYPITGAVVLYCQLMRAAIVLTHIPVPQSSMRLPVVVPLSYNVGIWQLPESFLLVVVVLHADILWVVFPLLEGFGPQKNTNLIECAFWRSSFVRTRIVLTLAEAWLVDPCTVKTSQSEVTAEYKFTQARWKM